MNILTIDFETLFTDEYSLSRMTTEAYIRDPRFEAHGLGVRDDNGTTIWIAQPEKSLVSAFDWENLAVLCHHAAFDGLILSHHFGVIPHKWLDTYSMAQFLFGAEQSKSLGALASRFGLAPKTLPYDQMKGRHWGDMSQETRRAVADGCLDDCELTHAIFVKMMKGTYE